MLELEFHIKTISETFFLMTIEKREMGNNIDLVAYYI